MTPMKCGCARGCGCKSCANCRYRAHDRRRNADPEWRAKRLREAREWRAANPEAYKERQRQYYVRNKYTSLRQYRIVREHGITREEALVLMARAACDVCGATSPGSVRNWHIDHDHATGKVRGVLCLACNVRLVKVLETVSPEIVERARAYLADPPGIYGKPHLKESA